MARSRFFFYDWTDLRVPKRPSPDPNDFFRALKRVQLGEARSILDPLPQLQNPQPARAAADQDRISQSLDAESLGGPEADCPPDPPIELQGADVAPTPDNYEILASQRNTLDTDRKIRQQIDASVRGTSRHWDGAGGLEPDATNTAMHHTETVDAVEADGESGNDNTRADDEDQELAAFVSRHLGQARQSDQASATEDDGFLDPEEQQDQPSEQLSGSGTPSERPAPARVTSAFSHLQGKELEDTTSTVEYQLAPFDLSPFELAFALWEKKHNISRSAHSHLREVLQLVQDVGELRSIPWRKDTMMRRLHRVATAKPGDAIRVEPTEVKRMPKSQSKRYKRKEKRKFLSVDDDPDLYIPSDVE